MEFSNILSVVYADISLLVQCYSSIVCPLQVLEIFMLFTFVLGLFSSRVILYTSAVKSASGHTEVRKAKDAIEAYKNITEAINAAEAAANEAKDAADNALNVSNRLDILNIK